MASVQKNNVIYSSNNWDDINSKYNLFNDVEIIIKEKDSQLASSNLTSFTWGLRSILAVGVFSIFGNLPVQSYLQSTININVDTNTYASSILQSNKKHTMSFHNTQVEKRQESSNNDYIFDINSEPQRLNLPERALTTYTSYPSKDNNSKWRGYQVTSYDNLTNIFHKIGFKDTLNIISKNKQLIEKLNQLNKKGTIVRASSTNGELSKLIFSDNLNNSYVVTRNADASYTGTFKKDVFELRQSRSSFIIKNGLFFDARKSGISNDIIKQFVKAFDWDIDFSHDVRIGDKVTVVFEEIFHDGDKVSTRYLLAAEFINKKREFRTIRYVNKDGKADYFTPQGREMKRAFIRTPIAHARVSSPFNPGRYHPVLHKFKKHEGTDFSARRGTPIMATGNGTIKYIGRKGGYGRVIIIRHREGYTTTYAHMSRYNKKIKKGQKVYQGDIIGYVGSSGLTTGPHLHYELRQNGKAVNAMTVSLPNSMSLSRKELQDFRNKAISLVLQLNVLHRFVEANIEIDSSIGG